MGRLKLNERLNISVSENLRTITITDLVQLLLHYVTVWQKQDDDIDNFKNRRVRSVGELLQNQFRIGLNRLERNISEKLTVRETKRLSTVVNPKPVISSIENFWLKPIVTIFRPN